MKLFIKNMVCDRCKMAVRSELYQLDLHPLSIELGEIELAEANLSPATYDAVKQRLEEIGFELLDDKERQTIEQIKAAIITLIHSDSGDVPIKYSEYLSRQTGRDYAYLSKLFSEKEGTTIEQFTILQKIEKVKELLAYGELTLSEIAWKQGYSSVAALSSQFKKVMGMTPSEFKAAEHKGRKTLDSIK